MTAHANNSLPLHADDFWTFSLELYQQPNVAAQCLTLQDKYGCNVNILLLCCWLHRLQIPLSAEGIHALHEATQTIEQKLQFHRAQRRLAKTNTSAAHYEALKQQELTMERQQQAELIKCLNKHISIDQPSSDPIETFCTFNQLDESTKHKHLVPILAQIQ